MDYTCRIYVCQTLSTFWKLKTSLICNFVNLYLFISSVSLWKILKQRLVIVVTTFGGRAFPEPWLLFAQNGNETIFLLCCPFSFFTHLYFVVLVFKHFTCLLFKVVIPMAKKRRQQSIKFDKKNVNLAPRILQCYHFVFGNIFPGWISFDMKKWIIFGLWYHI